MLFYIAMILWCLFGILVGNALAGSVGALMGGALAVGLCVLYGYWSEFPRKK